MKDSNFLLPIMPLPVFLLPEGKARLRIFEPRYLKMVKIATQGKGFIICQSQQELDDNALQWGSWVEVVNFDQGIDGILEIDVKCKTLVDINSIRSDIDNLYFATVSEIFHWSQTLDETPADDLCKSLVALFANDTLLKELYSIQHVHNTSWVVARWLEILPVNIMIKSTFIDVNHYDQAKYFVETIIGQKKLNKNDPL